jgi:lipopolysaccharide/colanic/teichoic acid biosynthesis glycosyltransferase
MVAIAVKLDSKGPVFFKQQFCPSVGVHWEA